MCAKRKASASSSESDSESDYSPSKKKKSVSKETKQKPKNSKSKKSDTKENANSANIEKTIEEFLLSKSRPYPLSELLITFKKNGTKADIIKGLDTLSNNGILIKKEFGKTIMYLGSKEPSNLCDTEIDALKEELKDRETVLNKLKGEVVEIKNEISEVCKYPRNEEIVKILKSKTKEAMENKKRTADLTAGTIKISKEEMDKISKELNKFKKIYKERVMIFKNIFETLQENSGMKKAELMEEIGLEDRSKS